MQKTTALLTGAFLTALAFAAAAQEDDDTPEMYAYASYFSCPGGSLSAADAEIAADKERMDKFVADGVITGWNYLAHHTGGSWQRIFVHTATSLDALLDGSGAIQDAGDDGDDADADDGASFGEICNHHDDYIWQLTAGKSGPEPAAVSFSVYHVCDITSEDRADEIVTEHLAPILDKMVDDGKLTNWGWMSHVVGGKYRKLQILGGKDHKSVLAARTEAIATIYGEDDAAGEEFSEICGPHVDYMWNIVH